MKYKIGVIGSARGTPSDELLSRVRRIGEELVAHDCYILTGGTTGLSYEVVKAAKQKGGFTIGVSPAENEDQHENRYKFPTDNFDLMVYTGFGLKGRNVVMVRSSDGVIALSGGTGTLNEFTIAYDERKPIGILKKSDGLPEKVVPFIDANYKKGGKVFLQYNPKKLVEELLKNLRPRLISL